jgi:hypothetical protein
MEGKRTVPEALSGFEIGFVGSGPATAHARQLKEE